MKFNTLPAITWIALGFAAVLVTGIASVHHFQIPADRFMSPVFWWMDLAGLTVATGTWVNRALRRPAPILPDAAELSRLSAEQSQRIARELNHA